MGMQGARRSSVFLLVHWEDHQDLDQGGGSANDQQKPAVPLFSQETYRNLLTLHWAHVRSLERDEYEKYS